MGREADELVDVDLFEAFPDNPNDPLADGVAALSASLEQVGRRQRWHDMQVQRYDVRDRRSGEWALRVWHPTNSPVVEDGRVTALVHQVQDITPSGDDLHRALMSYRDLLGSGDRTAGHDHPVARRIDTSLAMLADHEALVAEVVQLRRALKSRATIDQAKGMLMAQHHCDADVALALVYQATRPADPDPI